MSLKGVGLSKAKKFSPSDLEMAYAFHNKFEQQEVKKPDPPFPRGVSAPPHTSNIGGHQISPSHRPPAPHYRLNTSSQHAPNALGQQMQQNSAFPGQGFMQTGQGGFPGKMMQGDPGHGELFGKHVPQNRAGHMPNPNATRYSGRDMQFGGGGPTGYAQQQDRDEQRMSMLLAANINTDHQPSMTTSTDYDRRMMSSTMQLYPLGGGPGQERQPHPLHGPGGNREVLGTSRTSGEQKLNYFHSLCLSCSN